MRTALLALCGFAVLLGASGCGDEDTQLVLLPEGAPASLQSLGAPITMEASTSETVTTRIEGTPGYTFEYAFTTDAGTVDPASGSATLGENGAAVLTVTHTAPSATGPYTITLTLTTANGEETYTADVYAVEPIGTLVQTITAPNSNNMGLAWDGTYLWVSDRVADQVHRLDPTDGTVLDSFAAPDSDPRGMGWDGSAIWMVGNTANQAFELDPDTGATLSSFTPAYGGSYVSDVAWDGEAWWVSSYNGTEIHRSDSAGAELAAIPAPDTFARGLEWVAGNLWQVQANCSPVTLYLIDSNDGAVLDSFAPSGADACAGIAFDGAYLWLSSFSSANLNRYSPGTLFPR